MDSRPLTYLGSPWFYLCFGIFVALLTVLQMRMGSIGSTWGIGPLYRKDSPIAFAVLISIWIAFSLALIALGVTGLLGFWHPGLVWL